MIADPSNREELENLHLKALAEEQRARSRMWDAIALGVTALVDLAKKAFADEAERRKIRGGR